jgi:hypothetical protein
MSDFSAGQIMLTLSLLSARGFWKSKKKNQKHLSEAISCGLDELKPLNGDWKLVWGPGTYRYLGSAFDSSMMFVVQNTRQTSRFAIVVRGTNPVDVYDWLLGDFLAHRQVPWHPSDKNIAPGAKLSLSTALGLKILLNMRAENDPVQITEPGKFDYIMERGATAASTIQHAGDTSLAKVDDLLNASLAAPAYDKLRKLARKLLKYQKLWNLVEIVDGNIAFKAGEILNVEDVAKVLKIRKRLTKTLDKTMETFTEEPVAMLMPSLEELSKKQESGMRLLELLANLAKTHGDKLELFVTGHSKGGALAPALALFLSDTQRNDQIPVRRHYQWNPAHRAKIYCYAFAGPTPGNTAFANYFNQQLGREFFRYSNKLDIVTLAWQSEQLRTISGIYGESVSSLPGLDLLFSEMAESVENMDYCHPGEDFPATDAPGSKLEKHVIEFSGPLQENTSSYVLQEFHQHIAAYINFLGLDHVMDLKGLIGLKK